MSCQILEERNTKLNGIVAKHEQASETMRAETMGLQSRLSQVRAIRLLTLCSIIRIKSIISSNELINHRVDRLN